MQSGEKELEEEVETEERGKERERDRNGHATLSASWMGEDYGPH